MSGNSQTQLEWIKKLQVKRLVNANAVFFVVTPDIYLRVRQLVRNVYNNYNEVLVFNPWEGVRKVVVSNGKIKFEVVSLGSQESPYGLNIPQQQVVTLYDFLRFFQDRCRQLHQLYQSSKLYQVEEGREVKFNVLGIVWGIEISDQERKAFAEAVKYFALSDFLYTTNSTLVFFVESIANLPQSVIQHVAVIEANPSIEEYRAIISKVKDYTDLTEDELLNLIKGLSLHDAETTILETFEETGKIDAHKILKAKADVIKAKSGGLLEFVEPKFGFEAVGGYDYVKEILIRDFVEYWKYRDLAKELGLELPRGILFFGAPGTGKTWTTLALAYECKLPVFKLSAQIFSKWFGETEQNIEKVIKTLEASAPCILFIDEVDALFTRRGSYQEHEVNRRAKNMFLEWLGMPDRKTIVVATTNRPEDLDEAFMRAGRIDIKIPFLYPDFEARKQILHVHTNVVRKVPLENVNLEDIALRTAMFSGAELEKLVLEACREAFRERSRRVTMKHFLTALENFNINVKERMKQIDHYLRLAEEFGSDKRFIEKVKKIYECEKEISEEVSEGRLEVALRRIQKLKSS